MTPKTISVIGGLDADLIMIASRIPDPGESVLASHYQEVLGGKGANSAIAAFRTCHDKVSQKENYLDLETTSAGYPAGQPSTAATEKESNTDSDEENIEVKMIGAVGDDRYGERFIDELKKERCRYFRDRDSPGYTFEYLLCHGRGPNP